jgi:hypothetical protein
MEARIEPPDDWVDANRMRSATKQPSNTPIDASGSDSSGRVVEQFAGRLDAAAVDALIQGTAGIRSQRTRHLKEESTWLNNRPSIANRGHAATISN